MTENPIYLAKIVEQDGVLLLAAEPDLFKKLGFEADDVIALTEQEEFVLVKKIDKALVEEER